MSNTNSTHGVTQIKRDGDDLDDDKDDLDDEEESVPCSPTRLSASEQSSPAARSSSNNSSNKKPPLTAHNNYTISNKNYDTIISSRRLSMDSSQSCSGSVRNQQNFSRHHQEQEQEQEHTKDAGTSSPFKQQLSRQLRASSCDSLGMMFNVEQMRQQLNTTTTTTTTTTHTDDDINNTVMTNIDSKHDGQQQKAELVTNHSTTPFDATETSLITNNNKSNIPFEKATVLTKLQKWGDYESCGESVGLTKFVPMKTPLSLEFLERTEKYAHILTVEKMLYEQREMKQRVIGFMIDLSNHECLYEEDIPKEVTRVHVRNVAKSIPSLECCEKVIQEAQKFWKIHPDEYIAIHCAYGFNRTGFIVCCYLIEKENMTAEEALEAFALARPPGVKHETFQLALKARYAEKENKPTRTKYDDEDKETAHVEEINNVEKVEGVKNTKVVAAICQIGKSLSSLSSSSSNMQTKEKKKHSLFGLRLPTSLFSKRKSHKEGGSDMNT